MALDKGTRSTFHLAILSLSCFCSFVQERGTQVTAPMNVPSNLFLKNGCSARPLSWEWKLNNLRKNYAWLKSNFFGIPRNAQEAQEMLSAALKKNRSILIWAAIISGGLLLASAGAWWYRNHLQKKHNFEQNRKKFEAPSSEEARELSIDGYPQLDAQFHPDYESLSDTRNASAFAAIAILVGTYAYQACKIEILRQWSLTE